MDSFAVKMKRFLQNKDTVTFLGIVLLILALYLAYTIRVQNQIKTVSVPYANTNIMAGTKITRDMVSIRQVPASMVGKGVLTRPQDIINRYTLGTSIIPKGSLFYDQAVVSAEDAAISAELSYPEGYRKYTLSTSVDATYGNSILPGNYVDIWMSVRPDLASKKLLIGKLISNVKIISVRDSTGAHVFQNLDENLTPAILNFALPSDCFDLLTAATKINRTFQPEIKIIPTNESLKEEPGDTQIASDKLREWVSTHVEYVE